MWSSFETSFQAFAQISAQPKAHNCVMILHIQGKYFYFDPTKEYLWNGAELCGQPLRAVTHVSKKKKKLN